LPHFIAHTVHASLWQLLLYLAILLAIYCLRLVCQS
jgi:hypothetical protein